MSMNLWIGAIQSNDCEYRFKWCESGEVLLRNDSKWLVSLKILKILPQSHKIIYLSSFDRYPGQPDNENKLDQCVRLDMQTNAVDVGQFYDWDCNQKLRYICEVYYTEI